MSITRNAVFTRAANAARAYNSAIKPVGKRISKPASWPGVSIIEIDAPELAQAVTLASDDDQRRSVFEVQVFSNLTSGGTEEVSNVMSVIQTAFKAMYYRCAMNEFVENSDPAITRRVARFERFIGGGDTLPEA